MDLKDIMLSEIGQRKISYDLTYNVDPKKEKNEALSIGFSKS